MSTNTCIHCRNAKLEAVLLAARDFLYNELNEARDSHVLTDPLDELKVLEETILKADGLDAPIEPCPHYAGDVMGQIGVLRAALAPFADIARRHAEGKIFPMYHIQKDYALVQAAVDAMKATDPSAPSS